MWALLSFLFCFLNHSLFFAAYSFNMINMCQPRLKFSVCSLDGSVLLSGLGAIPVWNR